MSLINEKQNLEISDEVSESRNLIKAMDEKRVKFNGHPVRHNENEIVLKRMSNILCRSHE